MAFNPAYATAVDTRRHVNAEPDFESASILTESQLLWVVFNPAAETDILLFSTQLQTDADSLADELLEEQEEENDDLIDDLQMLLSNRINEWQLATLAAASDPAVLDNVALWDLDAELVLLLLDTLVLRRVPAFYGDHLFESMSPADYKRFKRASASLRRLLLARGTPRDKALLSRLLELLQWRNLINTSGSLVNDYIATTLARLHHWRSSVLSDAVSDTVTSLLMVMCGGASWNDL